MSRFDGWTNDDVEVLLKKQQNDALYKKVNGLYNNPSVKKLTPIKQAHINKIITALNILGIEAEKEYRFLTNRKFRFDVAVPDKKIAIEYEGGTYTRGRHTRGKGYANDCAKYNLAVLNGWRVLRYTVDITKNTTWEYIIAADVQRLIKGGEFKS